MFWLVSGKGRRRPFCPDDEWAGLTGHFSLPLSLSFSPSLFPLLFLLPLHLHPSSNSKPQFVSSEWGPGDGFHQVTDLSATARGKTPQTLGNARRPTAGETRLKRHLYLLGSQQRAAPIYLCNRGLCLHFSENCSHFPIQLESENFLIP